ncbi:MAG: hypothetical protein HY790_05055 [Deltaproteobacteria bacterium]|nr:hypothetical protein [Deltaproteobacteria bacterium]
MGFCPNAESLPNPVQDPQASWNRASNYYPGDDYVDLLGMDGYNWGTTQTMEKNGWQSRWRSFQEIFAPMYQELRSLSPHKPLLVFETASAMEGGDKAWWIKETMPLLRSWQVQGRSGFRSTRKWTGASIAGGIFLTFPSSVSRLPLRSSGSKASLKNSVRVL